MKLSGGLPAGRIACDGKEKNLKSSDGGAYLTSDLDVSDSILRSHGEHEVSRLTLRLPDEKAAVLAFLQNHLLRLFAGYVTVEPPG